MKTIKIKNLQATSDIYCGQTIGAGEYYTMQTEIEMQNFANDVKLNQHLWCDPAKICINDGESDLSAIDGDRYLKNNCITVVEMPPFARPDFRTKMNASASIIECAVNSSTNIDYQITEERYASGGSCSIKNAKFGDYITAEIYDKDSVIPEAYRASLCEDWPCVAKYIEKRWVLVDDDTKNINIFFDTQPLNAKISAGLYLRVTYHAINEGSTREVIVNYNLTKKL